MVGIEFIDDTQSSGTSSNERIDLDIFVEIRSRRAHHLIGVVLADNALTTDRIVRNSDSGEQKQPNIVHLKGTEYDDVSRLLNLPSISVDVENACGSLAGIV